MGFRYRKSISLGRGSRINFSKSGVSYSFGGKGFRCNLSSSRGIRNTFSIPGTGLSYTTSTSLSPFSKSRKRTSTSASSEKISYNQYSAGSYASFYANEPTLRDYLFLLSAIPPIFMFRWCYIVFPLLSVIALLLMKRPSTYHKGDGSLILAKIRSVNRLWFFIGLFVCVFSWILYVRLPNIDYLIICYILFIVSEWLVFFSTGAHSVLLPQSSPSVSDQSEPSPEPNEPNPDELDNSTSSDSSPSFTPRFSKPWQYAQRFDKDYDSDIGYEWFKICASPYLFNGFRPISRRIQSVRKACHMTQAQAAEKIGISASSLSAYENDLREPPEWVLDEMEKLYEVSFVFLAYGYVRDLEEHISLCQKYGEENYITSMCISTLAADRFFSDRLTEEDFKVCVLVNRLMELHIKRFSDPDASKNETPPRVFSSRQETDALKLEFVEKLKEKPWIQHDLYLAYSTQYRAAQRAIKELAEEGTIQREKFKNTYLLSLRSPSAAQETTQDVSEGEKEGAVIEEPPAETQ